MTEFDLNKLIAEHGPMGSLKVLFNENNQLKSKLDEKDTEIEWLGTLHLERTRFTDRIINQRDRYEKALDSIARFHASPECTTLQLNETLSEIARSALKETE